MSLDGISCLPTSLVVLANSPDSCLETLGVPDSLSKNVGKMSAKSPHRFSVAMSNMDAIVHDAEYTILEAQHGERWATEDTEIDAMLAEIREKNGGKPPNIVFILLDDLGFGEIGMPNLDVIRGYSTPNISDFADEGLSLMRMYTEPSCTPTRVAMMTGRLPNRTGFNEAKAIPEGEGLPGRCCCS